MKTDASDRTERLLAVLLIQTMKGATKAEKAVQLSLAGLTNVEISNLLETTPGLIGQLLYTARKKKVK